MRRRTIFVENLGVPERKMSEQTVKVDLPEPHHGRELFRCSEPDVVVNIYGDHGSGKGEVWIFIGDRKPEKIFEIAPVRKSAEEKG